MDCNFCDEPMEREDCYIRSTVGRIITKGATYVCHTCGREWQWELGKPGLRPLFAPEDFEENPFLTFFHSDDGPED